MAETHQEIVKVWIAPGCIVCDACESDCPEVFDVQEETCVIRPEAQKPEFTKPLTPSIIVAAEGCPVDVIKYDTIQVEGPEPWAGKEEEAAVGVGAAAGGGAAAKKAGWSPPEGPPDPYWAQLLATAHASGSRSAGGPAVTMRPAARAPAEAIVDSLSPDAPPDAVDAAMVGAGYSRPQPTVAERIRQKGARVAAAAGKTRRQFNAALLVGWGSIVAATGLALGALQSFMVPKITKEPPSIFRAGKRSDYEEVGVYTAYKPHGVWIVHLPNGRLIALSTTCTHLGCIPNWLANDSKFKCPCHGSGFYMNGINFEGPAPRPLERHKIYLDGETLMVDKSFKFRQELGQWDNPDSYIQM